MNFNPSLTELTTAATDAVLAVECIAVIIGLRRRRPAGWRLGLWCWVFGLIAFAGGLGAVAHGLDLAESVRTALWIPLYLGLGVLVALFAVGAIADWLGADRARRWVPGGVAVGVLFFGLTQLLDGAFVIFVVYEAVAMLGALAIYAGLAARRRQRGAGTMAVGVLINLAAAGLQANPVGFHLVVPFDHNGVFHLAQMAGVAVLALGVARTLPGSPDRC